MTDGILTKSEAFDRLNYWGINYCAQYYGDQMYMGYVHEWYKLNLVVETPSIVERWEAFIYYNFRETST